MKIVIKGRFWDFHRLNNSTDIFILFVPCLLLPYHGWHISQSILTIFTLRFYWLWWGVNSSCKKELPHQNVIKERWRNEKKSSLTLNMCGSDMFCLCWNHATGRVCPGRRILYCDCGVAEAGQTVAQIHQYNHNHGKYADAERPRSGADQYVPSK